MNNGFKGLKKKITLLVGWSNILSKIIKQAFYSINDYFVLLFEIYILFKILF